jgi:hypothetical protein
VNRWLVLLQDDKGHVRASLHPAEHWQGGLYSSPLHDALATGAGAHRDNTGEWRFRTAADFVRVVAVEVAEWRVIDLDRHNPTAATAADEWRAL